MLKIMMRLSYFRDVSNKQVKAAVAACLQQLKDTPSRMERPKIYHLDVSAMYPNIMITNRLQPDSMIDESVCASCDFNRPGKTCDRRLPWSWRGEFFPAKRDEYNMLRRALQNETFPGKYPSAPPRRFDELSAVEQATHIQKRLSDYCRKVYHKIHETEVIEKEAIICQRENPFYIDTVKSFRDRRYEYKGHHKTWKKNVEEASGVSAVEEAKAMVILFDSLQLAHKVILNSFYGYVMRKGSRWYSMEMAGVTCLTGASLIQMARQLVERIGRPLELDTDGIWCVLPETFPENFTFKLRGGKTLWLSYPCAMLNHLVHARYTNDQYAELVDPATLKYKTSSENSIFFEIDGPYRAMILPASKEEDKNLKKRYAVFNDNGSLAELKGFEVKRRGELKLIKIFQTQIFKVFLEGTTLEECYSAVAKVANRWLDVLFSKGRTLADEELLELISENRSMSKVLEEYGSQKSTSITTAKRLAEFLGDQMVKDRGLACKYIISSMPKGAPVTERAVPVAIFSAEPTLKRHFLKIWLKDNSLGDLDLRSILDWNYYIERLGGVVQKLITIPAAMQQVENPVPKVAHPDWLRRRVNTANDKMKQRKVTDIFQKVSPPRLADVTNLSTPTTHGSKSIIPAKRKELHSAGSKENDPLGASLKEVAPSTDDYESWLAFQKRKWRAQRQSRIRRRKILGLGDKGLSNSLGGYFAHQSEPLFTQKWEIIQLRETDIPGQLKAFVMIDSKIVSVKINPVRKIYVNFKNSDLPNVDIENCAIQKVFKLLPNGSPSVNLFELSMPEHVYGANISKFRSIFNHHSVEGIYERQIPLKTRTLLDLGTACHVQVQDGGDVSHAIDLGFNVAHLRKLEEQTSYLHNTKFQYLYVYKVTNGRRHVFGLFSSVRTEAIVMVVDPSRDAPDIPNLAKLYGEQLTTQRAKGDHGSLVFEYTDHINFDSSKVKSEKAYSLLSKAIQKLQAERKAPTIVILDSKDSESLMKHLPTLRDYPILTYPSSDKELALPAVGWLQAASKRMINHFLRLSAWISHRIGLARYGNVPLCDIGEDETKFLTDILFARRLVEQNVVLWWSPTPYPDLGGRGNEDPYLTLQDIETPEFNSQGCYTTVCIELEIRNLPINTILTSALINELEGVDANPQIDNHPGTTFGDDDSGTAALSDNTFSSAAVSVLKSMVKHWWDEASIGNGIADLMVLHLLRWIQSSDACMYDRALHRHIEIITKKALLQLMGEFKKMGSKAIYASPTKIMLLTTKSSVGVAYAYANYVVKAIKSKPLFSFLDLSIQEYWDYLLWMDHVNYGGKACTEIESSEEQKLDTVLNWHIKSFLPIALQHEFQRWVIEFIDKMHEAKDPDNAARIPTQYRAAEPFSSPEHKRPNDEDVPPGIIDQHFAKPLISRVKYLIRRQGEAESRGDNELLETFSFPVVPGSTPRRNPTLQFVKYLCAIFALSKEHHLEARMLRRDLLSILDVAEFSKDGIFSDPSESFKLSEVVCSHCGSARDLDFCKDADLLPDEETNQAIAWRCIQCHHEYSQLALQERMVGQMQSLITAYQLQDLKCARCKQVRGDELSDHCVCSGEWVGSVGIMEMRKRLGVFKSVAEFYGLDMLRGAVDEVFMLADM
jgi:DNA polymerase epsilon subunit 1